MPPAQKGTNAIEEHEVSICLTEARVPFSVAYVFAPYATAIHYKRYRRYVSLVSAYDEVSSFEFAQFSVFAENVITLMKPG